MVSLFFGLPGSGKTTIMASFALKYTKRKKPYKHVYSNVHMSIPGLIYIENDFIGKYDLSDSLILIDEATLFADSRRYKEFSKDKLEFFLLHRHYNSDIILFTQQWDGVDRKIRVITDRVYYVYKGIFTRAFLSKYYRIPYGIIIPDGKNAGEKLGEIVQGYRKPPLLVRLFATKVFRPRYYKYFDSWEAPELPPLPSEYVAYEKPLKLKSGAAAEAAAPEGAGASPQIDQPRETSQPPIAPLVDQSKPPIDTLSLIDRVRSTPSAP